MGKKNKHRKNQKSKADDSQAQALQKVADMTIKESGTSEKVEDTSGSSLDISSSNRDENNEILSTVDPTDTVTTNTYEAPPITTNFIGASPNTVLAKSQLNPIAKEFTYFGNAGCSETNNKILQTMPDNNIPVPELTKHEDDHEQNSKKNCNYPRTPKNRENLAESDKSVLSGEDSPLLNKNSTVRNVKDRFHNKSHGTYSSEHRNQETDHRKQNHDEPPTKSKLNQRLNNKKGENNEGAWSVQNLSEQNYPTLSNEHQNNYSKNRETSKTLEYSGSRNLSGDSTKESRSRDQSDFSRNRDTSSGNNYTDETDDSKNWTDSSTKESLSWDQSDHSWESWNNNNRTTKANRSYNEKKLRDPRMERENTRNSCPESSDKTTERKMTRHSDDFSNNWRDHDSSFKANERKNTRHSLYHSSEDDKDRESLDKDYDHWDKNWKKVTEFNIVNEIDGDLFQQPKDFSLAHCVAEDLRMGSGIAVEFKQQFKNVGDLMQQRPKQGGLAVLKDPKNERFVYYLVTKRESNLKPTYYTLWKSLCKMRDHIKEHKVKKLAIPRIGCGLDRLEWERVKAMLELLFKDVEEFQIQVCNFQQLEDTPTPKKYYPCKLVPYAEHVTKIDQGTAVFYFTTEQSDKDDTFQALAEKFTFMPRFNAQKFKTVGDFILYEDKVKNYLLCGCVVRKSTKDLFDFKGFSKCLSQFSKTNRKYGNDAFYYVAFQKLDGEEYRDDLINEKIITLFTNMLRDVEVYYCSGFLQTEST